MADLDWLESQGVQVDRYALSLQPEVFAAVAAVQQALVNPLGSISLVAGQRDRPGDRLAVLIKKFRIGAFEYGDQRGRFVGLSRRQMVPQRMAFTVAQNMNFRRKAPARAA